MAVAICDGCSRLVDLDWIEGYTEDGEHCFCEGCMEDFLEAQEEGYDDD